MNIFFLEWNSFGNEDMIENLENMGHCVIRVPFSDDKISEQELTTLLERFLKQSDCSFVFTFNYYPNVSNACKKLGLKYVSWVYDSPHIQVFSYTVINDCNYVFLFDYALYEELHSQGIRTVYYLPLAINTLRMERLDREMISGKFVNDVAFVGSLYSEKKHRLYDKFDAVSPYVKGYLDAIIRVQKNVQGYNFLREMLTEDILAEMQKAYPTDPNATTVLSPEALYADYVLARQVTAMERLEVLQAVGRVTPGAALYTYENSVNIPGVTNRGPVDYYDAMPGVFRGSRINLNITLRSIRTGIPLRALDIMGNGGFLLTNYQEELLQYLIPEEDFVYYTDSLDLQDKITYYLEHEEERKQIAENGCKKARELFDYRIAIQTILDTIAGERV